MFSSCSVLAIDSVVASQRAASRDVKAHSCGFVRKQAFRLLM